MNGMMVAAYNYNVYENEVGYENSTEARGMDDQTMAQMFFCVEVRCPDLEFLPHLASLET
jgi:hypothetical protein